MTTARWLESAWRVTALYAAVAVATTWPLATRPASSLPSDLGDPVLNAFILDWGLTHLTALAGGDLAAFSTFWHAPIFHPEPLALAYSEHLLTQAVTVWPVYALGGNILLCYNLVFLSTFVLSGLGMYLFTRELTGSGAAAFVAGLVFGFALYRVAQFPHLQTLSSQWLPFALYGFRRFFVTRAWRPLLGATLALIAQNLANGYFLLFFSPMVAAYCLVEIADRRLWRDGRVLIGIASAAVMTAAATVPVLVPYLALRAVGFEPRGLTEVLAFSADALAWITAAPDLRVWGWLRTVPKPEGELFPGLAVVVLAALAVVPYTVRLWKAAPRERSRVRQVAAILATICALIFLAFTLLVEATGDSYWRVFGVRVTLRTPLRGYVSAALVGGLAFALSRRAQTMVVGERGGLVGFFAVAALASAVLALGPILEIAGVTTGVPLPYWLLYSLVPGFDGLRVPARFAMLTLVCLAVLAAFGAQALLARGAGGARVLAVLAALFLAESTSAPIGIDKRLAPAAGVAAGPPRALMGDEAPRVYRYLSTLPATTVVIEFPFGAPAWDIPSVFYQRVHRHPLVNGFSGGFPLSFRENLDAFDHLDIVPGVAWHRLRQSGATHAVVRRDAYLPGRAAPVERWLLAHGARLTGVFDTDVVYEVP